MNKSFTYSFLSIQNNSSFEFSDIPILEYKQFTEQVINLFNSSNEIHCLQYFAIPYLKGFKFILILANDNTHDFLVFGHQITSLDTSLESITQHINAFHIFEREIHENYNIQFLNHPWLKPVRYAENRADKSKQIKNYPFYKIDGEELHEVSVGPIHAGIIESGHFRFLCHGEMVKHLEIQLGWQHRGIETLMLSKKKWLQRSILAESITGDSAIAHNLAFTQTIESLASIKITNNLTIERSIALELERIAIHTGDLSGMCTDVAYQLGSAVFSGLRTPIINFTQRWCGNRFGKGLIRIGGTYYPLINDLQIDLASILIDFEKKFVEMAEKMFNLPSVLKRFDGIGAVFTNKLLQIGAVGMVAKAGGIARDIRKSHPFLAYKNLNIKPVQFETGDVLARGLVRYYEVIQSIAIIKTLLSLYKNDELGDKPIYNLQLRANAISISAVEGWRGEIVHLAITDEKGNLKYYKIKDPSMHNQGKLTLFL
ncbi:NADH-quinone oxidoreductase subunit C [Lutibacter sp.]|uniref:hydrogenase large subunit n=1 Tax=Lutibacter sp. TaxID=1925666 RepID=UPI0025B96088|nr:NADH-quinone oxidoreductase subunit C [Lutibacter sp.]MCF6182551.1 NADH-quinone oxidoreductase subunit C [Lutibacter sp.]